MPLSLLADRWSRVKSIFLMALVWSLATIACAFAAKLRDSCSPRAASSASAKPRTDRRRRVAGHASFPTRMRSYGARRLSSLAGLILGSVLGVVLGGFIAERWGWQAGFGAVGVPGLLFAVAASSLIVRDYKTGRAARREPWPDGRSSMSRARAVVAALLRPRTGAHRVHRRRVPAPDAVDDLRVAADAIFNRYYGLAPTRRASRQGLVVLMGGVGAVVWGVLADRLSAAHRACAPVRSGRRRRADRCR